MNKRQTIRLNERQFNSLINNIVKESLNRLLMERKYGDEPYDGPYWQDPDEPNYSVEMETPYIPPKKGESHEDYFKRMENEFSWGRHDKNTFVGNSDYYGKRRPYTKSELPDIEDRIMGGRYSHQYFDDFDDGMGDSIMNGWVHGNLDLDQVDDLTRRSMNA